MTKREALKKLRKLNRTRKLYSETKNWGDRQSEKIEYHKTWIFEARKAIKAGGSSAEVTFFTEHDTPDEFYGL